MERCGTGAGSEQELAVAVEHTCELQAWPGRPRCAPPGGLGRGPGRPLTPCSLAPSITHTRLPPRRSPGESTCGGRHPSRKTAEGHAPPPPTPPRAHARTHGQKTKGDPETPVVPRSTTFLGPRPRESPAQWGRPGAAQAEPWARCGVSQTVRIPDGTSWAPLSRGPRSRAH